jgi:hypothetical protein
MPHDLRLYSGITTQGKHVNQEPDATKSCVHKRGKQYTRFFKASQAGSGQVRQICQRCGVASGEAWCSSGMALQP